MIHSVVPCTMVIVQGNVRRCHSGQIRCVFLHEQPQVVWGFHGDGLRRKRCQLVPVPQVFLLQHQTHVDVRRNSVSSVQNWFIICPRGGRDLSVVLGHRSDVQSLWRQSIDPQLKPIHNWFEGGNAFVSQCARVSHVSYLSKAFLVSQSIVFVLIVNRNPSSVSSSIVGVFVHLVR